MDRPLHPLTRLLLIVWALVTIPGGIALIFVQTFATSVVWPPPLDAVPFFHGQLNGAIGIATGIASLLALRANRWNAAQPIIGLYVVYAIAAEYVMLSKVASGPVPFQSWFYIILGAFYLLVSAMIWRIQTQDSAITA